MEYDAKPPVSPAAAGPLARLGDVLGQLRALPTDQQAALLEQHGRYLATLLPLLGPLFGLSVLAFAAWDWMVDPQQAPLTLLVRVALVAVGAVAYRAGALPWSAAQRCGFIYWTHASAIILCAFLLRDGLLYGLAGIAASVVAVCAVTLRLRTFVWNVSVPSILFVLLVAAADIGRLAMLNSLILYACSLGLAATLMVVIRSFRQKAFLLERELLRLTRHDAMTGAINRAYLGELAEREVAMARRHGRALAIAMLDIDRFKSVNDTYGHAVGDAVICALVDTCHARLRAIDYFGRLGGEEFVCVFPDTGASEALQCAERLRNAVAGLTVATPQGPLHFTISIGVAILTPRHGDWTELLKDADMAMYRAKQEGRNRVILAGPAGAEPA
jgi:diguanylate cyclase (GGDEF)-like protein